MNLNLQDLSDRDSQINKQRLVREMLTVRQCLINFEDATNGVLLLYLPPISLNGDKEHYYVKTDVSVNTVTIYPDGTDTIEGATSLVLAAQYDAATLIPHNGVWYIKL